LKGGRSQILARTARLSGEASSFYFNGLILELLESCRDGEEVPAWQERWENETIAEFESDILEYPQGDRLVPAWGYFPIKHHRFHPGNLIFKLMHQWGAIAADLDSSSMVLTRLLKSGSKRITAEEILTLVEEHMRHRGKYGMNTLAYDNGVAEGDSGALLWVQEKHNELDAGVNVNVLCLLAAVMTIADEPGCTRAARLSATIWDFLGRHIGRGSYAKRPFLMFYSLEAFSFLWHRLAVCLEGMDPAMRARFDPEEVCGKLGRHLADLLEKEIQAGAPAFNSFDKLLSLPVLIRHASPSAKPWLSAASLRAMVEEVSSQPYEFGKFVYPFTFLYGNQALGLCAALNALRELDRHCALADPKERTGMRSP